MGEESGIRQLAWEMALEEERNFATYQPFKNEKVINLRNNQPPPQPTANIPLQTYCAADLEGKLVPARQWLVEGVIPHRNVTLLAGDGGIGKTVLLLNLFAHIAARLDWLGFKTIRARCSMSALRTKRTRYTVASTLCAKRWVCGGVSFATSTIYPSRVKMRSWQRSIERRAQ